MCVSKIIQVTLSDAGVYNILGLFLSGPQLSNEVIDHFYILHAIEKRQVISVFLLKVASYFLVNCVGPHLKSEHFEQLEEALSQYPSLAEPLLTKTATSGGE